MCRWGIWMRLCTWDYQILCAVCGSRLKLNAAIWFFRISSQVIYTLGKSQVFCICNKSSITEGFLVGIVEFILLKFMCRLKLRCRWTMSIYLRFDEFCVKCSSERLVLNVLSQAGRAGRRQGASLAVILGRERALDVFYMKNPKKVCILTVCLSYTELFVLTFRSLNAWLWGL